MSTTPKIRELEKDGQRLRQFKPSLKGREQERRRLTIATGIHSWLYEDKVSDTELNARVQTEAQFSQFGRGEPVDDRDFVKRVEDQRQPFAPFGHEVWAIGVRFDPQYRFFGVFAIKDWFVILRQQRRDILEESADRWHQEIDRTLEQWRDMVPGCFPWSGDRLRDYLSNARKSDDRW